MDLLVQSGCCAYVKEMIAFYKGVGSDYSFCGGHVEIVYSATERWARYYTATSILCFSRLFGLRAW